MNILITTGIYPPDVGGPATFVPQIADKLSIKNNVNVITFSEIVNNTEKTKYEVTRIKRRQNKIIRFLKTFYCLQYNDQKALYIKFLPVLNNKKQAKKEYNLQGK